MTDERLLHAFSLLNAPAQPSDAFADRLFDDLAVDLGLRHDAGPSSIRARVRRALGLDRVPTGSTALRLAYQAALLGLLLALTAGTMYVASQLRKDPLPPQLTDLGAPGLVRLSQAAYANAPAVRYTIHDSAGDYSVASDGHGTWRSSGWDMAPGSYMLFDGRHTGIYDATSRSWQVIPVESGGPPFPMNDEFNWVKMSFPGLVATIETLDCSDAVDEGEAVVAGRTADHVRCPRLGLQYWLDRETHLVLRLAAKQGTFFWDGAPNGQDSVTEVTAFEVVEAPDAADFAWTGPTIGTREHGPVPGTKLVVGSPPPAWTGTTIGGKPFATETLRAPAALLLMWTSTESALGVYATFTEAAGRHPGVTSVVIGLADAGTMVGFTDQHPTSLDVVADGDQTIATAWGTLPIPEIVLIDRTGAVADVVSGGIAPADLDRVLGALEDGRPVPPVGPTASSEPSAGAPSPTPAFDFACTDAYVICREVGATLPAWSGQRLEGGTFESAALLGKPAVIWFTTFACVGQCAGWVPGELRTFASLAARYAGRATLLAVADGERNPGDTRAVLEAAGVDVPVIFDWDGTIARALDTNVGGVLILDAEGRVAGQAPGALDSPSISMALDRLLAAPTATPSGSAVP